MKSNAPTVVPADLRLVYRVHQARQPTDEELANPYLDYFTPIEAESGLPNEAAAIARAWELAQEERLEVGFVVVSSYETWMVHSLEPASVAEKQEIAHGTRYGFVWEPAGPPRDDRSQAVGDLQALWRTRGGRYGLVIEAERMERAEIVRLRLEFRERGVF
jgi:hypothetical protein